MTNRIVPIALTLVAMAGCVPTEGAEQASRSVPDAVRAAAAPYQDISTARVRPEDGCYWYLHRGPVETTLLPLRTPDGRPICTRAPA